MGILFVPDAFSQGSDTTPPTITIPSDISSTSTNLSGTAVTFDVTATDNVAVTSGPTCSPASGSNFSVGTTTVTCTATDAAGNVGTASFTVTVLPPLTIDVQTLDDNGSPITDLSNIPQDEDIEFVIDVTNNQSVGQLFAVYVQIRDANGALAQQVDRDDDYLQAGTESTEWGDFEYWVVPGSYTATLFFLDENDLTPLADPVTIEFTKTGNTNLFDTDFPPTTSHSDELGTVVQDGPITIGVEKASYNISEIVTISGTIENYNGVDSVLLSISDSYSIRSLHQISPDTSGAFSVNEVLSTNTFYNSGTYTVKAQSGSDSAETSFVFNDSIFPEPAVATYLDNNQIETLAQLPTVNDYREYVVALHWQEDLKPLLLGLNNVHMMFSLLQDSIGDRCSAAWNTHQQTTRYNPDGTERDEYLLTRENAELLCELNNDYLYDIRNYMSQGMNLQSAISQVDPRAQQEISDYEYEFEHIEDEFEQIEDQPFPVGACAYGAVLIDEVCESVSTPYFMANPRIVDPFGNPITNVGTGQQIQIAADIANVQSTEQQFAYITVVRNADGAVVNDGLSWITSSIPGGYSISPALSWTPYFGGSYTATVFLIDSVDNPIPISNSVTTSFNVAGMECPYCITPTDVSDNAVTEGLQSSGGPISIAAEKSFYNTGEIIEISGTIENYDGTSDVSILIFSSNGNLATLNQVTPDASGAFSVDEPTAGQIFGSGTHTVKAQSGSDSAETTFDFLELIFEAVVDEENPLAELEAEILAFFDSNPNYQTYDDLDDIPEYSVSRDRFEQYGQYKGALYYQEHLKPDLLMGMVGLTVDEQVNMLFAITNAQSQPCNDLWNVYMEIPTFNPDGTLNQDKELADANADLCSMSNESFHIDGMRMKIQQGMSFEVAMSQNDEPVENQIQNYLNPGWDLDCGPGAHPHPTEENECVFDEEEFPCGGNEVLINGECVESSDATVITIASGSSTPGCEPNCFILSTITISAGDSVTWVNSDTAAHTATSGAIVDDIILGSVWDSSLIMAGGSYSITLDGLGTYPYFCKIHPWMTGTVVVGDFDPEPEPEVPSPILNVSVTKNEYDLDEQISLSVSLANTESNATVIVDVLDPAGNAVVTRAATVFPNSSESIQFRISDNFLTGNYKVVASANIGGNAISDITYFKIKSLYNQFQITSIQVTDQQGDPSILTKGTIGYVKVTITSDANITALVTVNLFDADLTTLGVGSVRSTIGEGESEIILSFLIPNNAALGDAQIFANGFTDWISNGGVPLTGEFSATEEIT